MKSRRAILRELMDLADRAEAEGKCIAFRGTLGHLYNTRTPPEAREYWAGEDMLIDASKYVFVDLDDERETRATRVDTLRAKLGHAERKLDRLKAYAAGYPQKKAEPVSR